MKLWFTAVKLIVDALAQEAPRRPPADAREGVIVMGPEDMLRTAATMTLKLDHEQINAIFKSASSLKEKAARMLVALAPKAFQPFAYSW